MKNKEKLNILFASKENIDSYVKFFEKAYEVNVIPFKSYKTIRNTDVDLIVFIGTSHIHPTNYKDKLGSTTTADLEKDYDEFDIHYRFNMSIPRIGIGRGAHLLTSCAGGKIIQDITGHKDTEHLVNTFQYGTYTIKSNHDQMMYPFNLKEEDYRLLGFTKHFQSTKYLNGVDEEFKLANSFLEPEIVQYPRINSLCFQLDPVDNESFDEISLLLIDRLLKKQFKKEVVQEISEEPGMRFGTSNFDTHRDRGFGTTIGVEDPYRGFYDIGKLSVSKSGTLNVKSTEEIISDEYQTMMAKLTKPQTSLRPKSEGKIVIKEGSWFSGFEDE